MILEFSLRFFSYGKAVWKQFLKWLKSMKESDLNWMLGNTKKFLNFFLIINEWTLHITLSSQIQVRENAIKTATEVCCSFVDRSTSLCLLKMSARLVSLGLLVFLEPESTYIFTRFLTTIVLKSKKYFVKMQECFFRKYFAMLRIVWNELGNELHSPF